MQIVGGRRRSRRRVCRLSANASRCVLRSRGKTHRECRKSKNTRRCRFRRSAKSRMNRPIRHSAKRVSIVGGGEDYMMGGRRRRSRRVCRISRKSGRCTLHKYGKTHPECRKSRKTRRCRLRRSAKSRSNRPVLGRPRHSSK